ncbi:unnamed protein product [Gongylonema pulchrum]|uniref:Uncharacterized protein n=1 Tax=Gongylonema pulchrum TaxID=637853 RepID=A0A183EVR2_9BILA|nr:unnamed protein product [Gongylonema pulchrum]
MRLLGSLESAKEKQRPQKAARLICAAIRELIDHRKEAGIWAQEPLICSSLMLFIKANSSFLVILLRKPISIETDQYPDDRGIKNLISAIFS